MGAAVFISINWLVYVYAVDTDQVVQTSLGYFINPLISVALGVILLRERLRALQWVAVGIAIIAVAVLTISYGTVPWISLTLAFSFGMYGFLKKLARIGSIESLAIETAALAPFALALMVMWEADGRAAFVLDGWQISALLVLLGPITALPLLAFGGAATRDSAFHAGRPAIHHADHAVPLRSIPVQRSHAYESLGRFPVRLGLTRRVLDRRLSIQPSIDQGQASGTARGDRSQRTDLDA